MSKADKLRIPDYLGHILEAIQRIHLYVEDLDEVSFLRTPRRKMPRFATLRLSGKHVETSSFTIPVSRLLNDLPGLAEQVRDIMGKMN